MLGVGTRLKKDIFKNNNQFSFTVTTRTWVLPTEWTRTWSSIGIWVKNWWWFPFVWMVDVVNEGAWGFYCINNDKDDESLPLLAFWRQFFNVIFLKNSSKDRLSTSYLRIRNMSSDVWYDDTIHYQVQFEHRRTQNLLKNLRGGIFS